MNFRNVLNIPRLFINGGMPVYLIFFVTALCDSKCRTCFNWKNLSKYDQSKELSLEEIDKIASNMNFLYQVTLGGGEPFLRTDIDEVAQIFHERNNAQIVTIPTNCMNPEIIAEKVDSILIKCPKLFLRLCLSLDGVGKLHDEIRGVPGNFKKFEETYKNLVHLRKRHGNFNIDVNTTVSHYNQDHLIETIDYVSEHFPEVNNHILSFTRGCVRDEKTKDVDPDKYEEAVRYVWLKTGGNEPRFLSRLFRSLQKVSREITMRTLVEKRRIVPCVAGNKIIVVDEQGSVFPCELLGKKMGNLRDVDYDLKIILDSDKGREIRAEINTKKCFCTWETINHFNPIFDIHSYPRIIKNLF